MIEKFIDYVESQESGTKVCRLEITRDEHDTWKAEVLIHHVKDNTPQVMRLWFRIAEGSGEDLNKVMEGLGV